MNKNDKLYIERRSVFAKNISDILGISMSNLKLDVSGFLQLFDVKELSYTIKSLTTGATLTRVFDTLVISPLDNKSFEAAIFNLIKGSYSDPYDIVSKGGNLIVIAYGSKNYFVALTHDLTLIMKRFMSAKHAVHRMKSSEPNKVDINSTIQSELDKGDVSLAKLINFFGEERVLQFMIDAHDDGVAEVLKGSKNPNIKTKLKNSTLEVFK
jgi:hypothetical protein